MLFTAEDIKLFMLGKKPLKLGEIQPGIVKIIKDKLQMMDGKTGSSQQSRSEEHGNREEDNQFSNQRKNHKKIAMKKNSSILFSIADVRTSWQGEKNTTRGTRKRENLSSGYAEILKKRKENKETPVCWNERKLFFKSMGIYVNSRGFLEFLRLVLTTGSYLYGKWWIAFADSRYISGLNSPWTTTTAAWIIIFFYFLFS